MHLDTKAPEEPSLVVIMPNLQALANSDRSSTFSWIVVSSLFFALYGSAFLEPVSALEKDIFGVVVWKVLAWKLFNLEQDAVSKGNRLLTCKLDGRSRRSAAKLFIIVIED